MCMLEKVIYEGTQASPGLFAESLEQDTEEWPYCCIREQHKHGF